MIQRCLEVTAGSDDENVNLSRNSQCMGNEDKILGTMEKKKSRSTDTFIGITQHRNSLLGTD